MFPTRVVFNSTFDAMRKAFPKLPKHVHIVEVGPRDGLQNEKEILSSGTFLQIVKGFNRNWKESMRLPFLHILTVLIYDSRKKIKCKYMEDLFGLHV